MNRWLRCLLTIIPFVVLSAGLVSADAQEKLDTPSAGADLSEYRTVDRAITTTTLRADSTAVAVPTHLGVLLESDTQQRLVVTDIEADSPAAKAGFQPGDLVLRLADKEIKSDEAFQEMLQSRAPGDALKIGVLRQGKPLELTATLAPASRPKSTARLRATLGLQVGAAKNGSGVAIEQVTPGSVAEKAKLKAGEVLLQIDGQSLTSVARLRELLDAKHPDDQVTLTLLLAEKPVEMKIKLGSEPVADGRSAAWDRRGDGTPRGGYWSKPTYRLAIVCIEYPDQKHNPEITSKAWEASMFSHGTYTKTNVTGQPVFGSLYDYYLEQSFGHLHVEGKAFDYVEVSKNRADYSTGNRMALLTEGLDKLLAREGKDALKDFDGVFFLYAGARFPAARGSLYWPHRATVTHKDRRWPYFICPEGGPRMANISVFCHEFGHMLGLPDLYARPENPGSEGLGVWCAMSNQVGNGRPQHFSAWCKEKLGWIKPVVIDPTVKQKLILAPVEDSPKECYKVLVRPDGSEYILLENRHKTGFDQSLPAEGLLIWRVVGNRPILHESHGIEGPAGPRTYLNLVPYPSTANDSYTPFTSPTSRSQLGGGLAVHLTNIRKLADGRITFEIGYEFE